MFETINRDVLILFPKQPLMNLSIKYLPFVFLCLCAFFSSCNSSQNKNVDTAALPLDTTQAVGIIQ